MIYELHTHIYSVLIKITIKSKGKGVPVLD
jgi:hypothetical protein